MDHDMNSPSPGSSHHEDDYDGDYVAIIQFNGGDEFDADFVMLFNDEQISVTVFAPYQSSESSLDSLVLLTKSTRARENSTAL